MAELSASGGYVKLVCNVWYDKKAKNVHITSNDKDLPSTHMHIAVKKGIQSDANLRALLNNFGCGPAAAEQEKGSEFSGILERIKAGELDDDIAQFQDALEYRAKMITNPLM